MAKINKKIFEDGILGQNKSMLPVLTTSFNREYIGMNANERKSAGEAGMFGMLM